MKQFALALALLFPASQAFDSVGAKVGGTTAPDGTEIQIDLPDNLHQANIASKGLGCCVFRSIDHAARWANIPALIGMPEWMKAKGIAGGGYPEKVAALIPKMCKDRGLPVPEFIQIEDSDLEILKAATKSGRMVSITYSISPSGRYGGRRIAHMVNASSCGAGSEEGKGDAGKGWWTILDNNYIGVKNYEWLSETEFKRATMNGGRYWAVVLLTHGPPPPPRN